MSVCSKCGDDYPVGRLNLGYRTCLDCGAREAVSARASWCVAPLNKSNYVLISNPADLRGLNPKRSGE